MNSIPSPKPEPGEEAFLYRLGRMVQALGYTPLFIMDRGFDRVSLMKRLQEWGMGFLIRLRQNRQVATAAGEVFLLRERNPQGPPPWPAVAVRVLDEILSAFPSRERDPQLGQGGGK